MKLITAIIRPNKLNEVSEALRAADIGKMTVSDVVGCGTQLGYTENYRGTELTNHLLPKKKVVLAVNEDFVEKAIDIICRTAASGSIGDGKIFVTDLQECIRIRTGERGSSAIG